MRLSFELIGIIRLCCLRMDNCNQGCNINVLIHACALSVDAVPRYKMHVLGLFNPRFGYAQEFAGLD